ncbi:uncharacterized protein LOC114299300 [Camellia sinensis]|uniref:uncharacterized protein LOC114299300 n=1 Tax=Camellia sinensis TaxID=4442 RepID=UPI0010357CFA|nr:uncharacterized protein LOC114299300 [Camellia sinensis]
MRSSVIEMKLKVLSWNVRGLYEKDKRLAVRSLLRNVRADVICLQETKMEVLGGDVVREIWGGRFVEWSYLPTVGTAGGVLLCWDNSVVVKKDEEVGERGSFLGELGDVAHQWCEPWCVGGDLNMVRWSVEKMGNTRVNRSMWAFSAFTDELNLVDLPLQGGNFTWSNGHHMSRIDRFLVTSGWEEHFSEVVQSCLPRPVSDHWPILLDSGGVRSGPTPFWFKNMWLHSEGFLERVRRWWSTYIVSGTPSCMLAQKLKLLKTYLKLWNKETFSQVEVLKAEVVDILQSLDAQEVSSGLLGVDVAKKEAAK